MKLSKGRNEHRMKTRTYLIMISAVIMMCCCCNALCESGDEAVLTQNEEWSWSRGAYNTFSGQIDLTGCPAGEVKICMTADLPYNSDTEQKSMPVFTSVNGKRIVMAKQSDTVQVTYDDEKASIAFSASFRLPEKQHITSVPLKFRLTDTDGHELKIITGRIESGEERSGRPFYIPVDINQITLILAAAAAFVWIIVLIRNLPTRKKQRTGE